jgi:hypothetical protein
VVVGTVRLVLNIAGVVKLRGVVAGLVGHRGAGTSARILARRLGPA